VGSIDHSTVNLELSEGIIDLRSGELVSEGHKGVSESLSIDLSVDLEGLEGLHDGLIVISATSHLASEQGDHLGEVHGSIGLIKHGLGLAASNGLAVVGESGGQVAGRQKAVLVDIHDTEGLLELLEGGVGEGVEDVGLLGHLGWLDSTGGVTKQKVSADT